MDFCYIERHMSLHIKSSLRSIFYWGFMFQFFYNLVSLITVQGITNVIIRSRWDNGLWTLWLINLILLGRFIQKYGTYKIAGMFVTYGSYSLCRKVTSLVTKIDLLLVTRIEHTSWIVFTKKNVKEFFSLWTP
jgi:hypothetical protein